LVQLVHLVNQLNEVNPDLQDLQESPAHQVHLAREGHLDLKVFKVSLGHQDQLVCQVKKVIEETQE